MPPTTVPPQTVNGIVTSFLPLTTTFTPDAGCPSALLLAGQTGSNLAAYDPRYSISVSSIQCQPSAAIESFLSPPSLNIQGNALVQLSIMPMTCPKDWSTVVSSVKDVTSTLAMCCPSGYSLANGISGVVIGSCASTVPSGATLTYASAPSSEGKSWVVTDLVVKEQSTIQVSPLIGWNTGPPATSTPSGASTASSTSAPTAGTTSPAQTEAVSTGLSTGAKAGIGIGSAIVVLALISFLVTFAIRKRKAARSTSPVPLPPDTIKEEPYLPSPTAEIQERNRGYELQAQTTGHELQADRGGEMDGEPRLPGYSLPAELP